MVRSRYVIVVFLALCYAGSPAPGLAQNALLISESRSAVCENAQSKCRDTQGVTRSHLEEYYILARARQAPSCGPRGKREPWGTPCGPIGLCNGKGVCCGRDDTSCLGPAPAGRS
jgi:hypothetical protein